MLNLKSYYRFNSELASEYESTKSTQSQWVTAGICDYIPQSYFSKQYFSVYIQAVDVIQIIQSILWNQFYEKTLLKQIYAQMLHIKREEVSLIAKLDNMVSKVSQMDNSPPNSQPNPNQIIYLKIHNKIFNLKDKLQFQSCAELQKDLKQHKFLNIQKISKQGKWKKVYIEFGPYKNKSQFDIVFTTSHNEPNSKLLGQKNIIIEAMDQEIELAGSKNDLNTKNSTKQSTKIHTKKQSTKSEIKQSKSVQNSSTKNKQNKQSPSYVTAAKSMSKSKISYPHSLNASAKKHEANQSEDKKKVRQGSTNKKENMTIQRQESSIRKSIESGSIRKGFNMFEGVQSDLNHLKQMNFNSTAKLSNQMSNLNEQELGIPPTSLDLRRKQKLKVKQNSIIQSNFKKQLIDESQIMRSYKDLGKNNSVLAQILSKKEQTIQFQKMKMQEMEKRQLKQIEELKIKHLKQTQGFKTEISNILNEYNKKYQNQKDQSKNLRLQLACLNEVLTNKKISIAQLQIKSKTSQDQSVRYLKENQQLKNKLKQMDTKFMTLLSESKQQCTRLTKQKQQSQELADKYLQKYNNIYKKMKLFVQQEDN